MGKTDIEQGVFTKALGISRERLRDWRGRQGESNKHNGQVPRHHQILPDERAAILAFQERNSLEGYRRLAYMMMDENVAFLSPATVYRVLSSEGRFGCRTKPASSKGTGFKHAGKPHQHWHTDITYVKIKGVFHYLILVLDGYSRYIVDWALGPTMTEKDVECAVQRAVERFPNAKPRIISDCGAQYTSRDFRQFMRLVGLTHTTTSPYYPQSNGKLERCNKTYLSDLEDAKRLIQAFVDYYNNERLHSAIGYVTPQAKLAGFETTIFAARDRGLSAAVERRRSIRSAAPVEMGEREAFAHQDGLRLDENAA